MVADMLDQNRSIRMIVAGGVFKRTGDCGANQWFGGGRAKCAVAVTECDLVGVMDIGRPLVIP